MPKFDRTGPTGQGPRTGRGFGPCSGAMSADRQGMGRQKGFGWRRFWGYCPAAALTKKEEKEILKEEVGFLEEELKATKDRLAQIKD